jgi:formate C-acetyltransferase
VTPRVARLRKQSFEAVPSISIERAVLVTRFYKKNHGRYSTPVLRALNFKYLCENKTIYIGSDELIVGERGPGPKAVSTFPELTCHTVEDLQILNSRQMTRYTISDEDIERYQKEVIPYWRGRTMRERVFNRVPPDWRTAYTAGLFTEFMEQRAPGHTTLDGIIYQKGMLDFKADIADHLARLDYLNDPRAADKAEELRAMDISCDAAIIFAERHAEQAEKMAGEETDSDRQEELEQIAATCRRVPAQAPRNFAEALRGILPKHCKLIGLYTWAPSPN